ncbi:MAG: MBL fold metallo-hydrolase [Candidatus Aminicenantes bacterium]|nr:MBL fold metallo-hydrolase [Candidatus Aminicenantes bacterium]
MKRILFCLSVFLLFVSIPFTAASSDSSQIKVTILYDNYVYAEGTQADWGFACLIQGAEKTILFDTGTKDNILFHNIRLLNMDSSEVEVVVISHEHGDHTGGLKAFLNENNGVVVYFPKSFSKQFYQFIEKAGAASTPVDEPVRLCDGVYSTGEMKGGRIAEQSLILDTHDGLVIITGCSHQGIVNILKKAKSMFDKPIDTVFGGFHLLEHSDEAVAEIIAQFKELGVSKCGATHCTGERQIGLFREAYGANFVEMGVGRVLTFKK